MYSGRVQSQFVHLLLSETLYGGIAARKVRFTHPRRHESAMCITTLHAIHMEGARRWISFIPNLDVDLGLT